MAKPLLALVDAWIGRRWLLRKAGRAPDARQPMAVVTGGSDGIGFALACEFGRAGHRPLLIARNETKLREAAARIEREIGAPVPFAAIDVTRATATQEIDDALARLGAYCDLLVNCAGIGLAGPFDGRTPEETTALLDLNVIALTRLMRHYLPAMRLRGRGGVLNVASTGGYAPGPWQAAYYASKAYVISLTEAVAFETAGEGVRIAVLVPGPVNTRFHERMQGESGHYQQLLLTMQPERVARVALLGYNWGGRVIVPGIFNAIAVVAMRIVPHFIVTPIIGFLLKPRARRGVGRA